MFRLLEVAWKFSGSKMTMKIYWSNA